MVINPDINSLSY